MIGERLQELRKDKGVSQIDLARLLGVSSNTISSYECDRSDPDDKIKIILAQFFDVSIDYLLGLINEPVSYRRENNTISLPKNFQEKDIEEIKEYISFIKFKKSLSDKRKNAFP